MQEHFYCLAAAADVKLAWRWTKNTQVTQKPANPNHVQDRNNTALLGSLQSQQLEEFHIPSFDFSADLLFVCVKQTLKKESRLEGQPLEWRLSFDVGRRFYWGPSFIQFQNLGFHTLVDHVAG